MEEWAGRRNVGQKARIIRIFSVFPARAHGIIVYAYTRRYREESVYGREWIYGMKKILAAAVALLTAFAAAAACCADEIVREPGKTWQLLADLAKAYEDPSQENMDRIDEDIAASEDAQGIEVARYWMELFLDPGFKLNVHGKDDPSAIPVEGAHAFVILGYQLVDGGMADELKGRCDAAAAAAKAFPDSVLVCSGGATGENNPEGHTEAGLMKQYLTEVCGIDPERVLTDENAMTTEENALNTLEILEQQGIETMTIVTSDYHERRGMSLYGAVAMRYRLEKGYAVRIVGNYCFDTNGGGETAAFESKICVVQLASILGLPAEDTMQLQKAVMGSRQNKDAGSAGKAPFLKKNR